MDGLYLRDLQPARPKWLMDTPWLYTRLAIGF